jgi:hypothetical protein
VSDLEVQRRLWGRNGHGIPGANPHYAGRAGIAAAIIAIIFVVAFVTLTSHSPKLSDMRSYDQFASDVASGNTLQTQLPQALKDHPKESSSIVHRLAGTLIEEDTLLEAGPWPLRVQGDIANFVRLNRQQISDLRLYLTSPASKRHSLLATQVSVAGHAVTFDAIIKDALDR